MLDLDAFEGCGRDAYDIERANTVDRELHYRLEAGTNLNVDHSSLPAGDIESSKGFGGADFERFPWSYNPNWDNAALNHVVRVEDVHDEVLSLIHI